MDLSLMDGATFLGLVAFVTALVSAALVLWHHSMYEKPTPKLYSDFHS